MLLPLSSIKFITVDYSHLAVAYVIPLGDFHIGSPFFRQDALEGYLKWIKSKPNAFVIGTGDWHHNDIAGNKACNVYTQTIRPQEQPKTSSDIMSFVGDRIWGAVAGNHDLRGSKTQDQDLMYQSMTLLGLENVYHPVACFITANVGTQQYMFYVTHGWGGARTSGAQVNKIEELAKAVYAEIYLVGHEHTITYSRNCHRYTLVQPDNSVKEVAVRQHFVGCGCFEDYDPFLTGIGRRPPDIGAPRIRLDGTKHDVHVSV